jgi:hypothetical protein
LDYTSL